MVLAALQVVAGTNYHITMNATDASGNTVRLHARVHHDLTGKHHLLASDTALVPLQHASPGSPEDGFNWQSAAAFGISFVIGALGIILVPRWSRSGAGKGLQTEQQGGQDEPAKAIAAAPVQQGGLDIQA